MVCASHAKPPNKPNQAESSQMKPKPNEAKAKPKPEPKAKPEKPAAATGEPAT